MLVILLKCANRHTQAFFVSLRSLSFVPRGWIGEREDLKSRHGGRSIDEDHQACCD